MANTTQQMTGAGRHYSRITICIHVVGKVVACHRAQVTLSRTRRRWQQIHAGRRVTCRNQRKRQVKLHILNLDMTMDSSNVQVEHLNYTCWRNKKERTAVPKKSPSGLNCTKTSRTTTQHPVRVVSPRSQASEQPEGRPLVRQRQQITLAPPWVGQPQATERTSDSPKRQRLDCHLPYLIYIRGPHAVIASCVGDNTRAR
jgi:hypothetical protein